MIAYLLLAENFNYNLGNYDCVIPCHAITIWISERNHQGQWTQLTLKKVEIARATYVKGPLTLCNLCRKKINNDRTFVDNLWISSQNRDRIASTGHLKNPHQLHERPFFKMTVWYWRIVTILWIFIFGNINVLSYNPQCQVVYFLLWRINFI